MIGLHPFTTFNAIRIIESKILKDDEFVFMKGDGIGICGNLRSFKQQLFRYEVNQIVDQVIREKVADGSVSKDWLPNQNPPT